jgi:hypothetical protein
MNNNAYHCSHALLQTHDASQAQRCVRGTQRWQQHVEHCELSTRVTSATRIDQCLLRDHHHCIQSLTAARPAAYRSTMQRVDSSASTRRVTANVIAPIRGEQWHGTDCAHTREHELHMRTQRRRHAARTERLADDNAHQHARTRC